MSVTVIDWKTWIICPVIGYFSIYNKKIISYNEGRVDTMTGMILIFMINKNLFHVTMSYLRIEFPTFYRSIFDKI